MNDQPCIEAAVEYRAFDIREQQLGLVLRGRKREAEQEIGGGVFSRDRNPERAGRDLFL